MFETLRSCLARFRACVFALAAVVLLLAAVPAAAQPPAPAASPAPAAHGGGEANLVLPDLGLVDFHGINGRTLLMLGLGVCVLGLAFGLVIYVRLKNLPVHRSMLEISELIYETCKTYLITQGKFILILWVFIGIISGIYFGGLATTTDPETGQLAQAGLENVRHELFIRGTEPVVATPEQKETEPPSTVPSVEPAPPAAGPDPKPVTPSLIATKSVTLDVCSTTGLLGITGVCTKITARSYALGLEPRVSCSRAFHDTRPRLATSNPPR